MGTQKKLLLTGSTGFIGKRLETMLRAQGNELVTVSRNGGEGAVAIHIDAKTDWSNLLADVDCVVHTAARVHVMKDRELDPLSAYRALNVAATENLARQAALSGVKRFVFLSSVKVCGESSVAMGRPFTEEDVPMPASPYGVSKLEAEEVLRTISKNTGMESVIVRPPLVYGPGVKANFNFMMKWISLGLPLPYGAISNKRSFVGLSNLASFITKCVESDLAANQTFFVSDGDDLSTSQLLQKLLVAFHRAPRLLPFPMKLLKFVCLMSGKREFVDRLVGSFQVDISKAKGILGWHPPCSVDEELAATVHQFLFDSKNARHMPSKSRYPGVSGR